MISTKKRACAGGLTLLLLPLLHRRRAVLASTTKKRGEESRLPCHHQELLFPKEDVDSIKISFLPPPPTPVKGLSSSNSLSPLIAASTKTHHPVSHQR